MPEPAVVHQLHEARELSPEAAQALLARIEELDEDNRGLRASLRLERRKNTKLRKEKDDLLGEAADSEEWAEFGEWWLKVTGRGPRTSLDLTSARCQAYRRLRRHWDRKEIAFMVVAALHDPYRVQKGWTDIPDLEKRAEDLCAAGQRIKGRKDA